MDFREEWVLFQSFVKENACDMHWSWNQLLAAASYLKLFHVLVTSHVVKTQPVWQQQLWNIPVYIKMLELVVDPKPSTDDWSALYNLKQGLV